MNRNIFFPLLAFLLTVFLINFLRKPARHAGLVDAPGGRKKHINEVPLIGGIAMFAAFLLTSLGMGNTNFSNFSFVAGMGLLVAVGILDDLHDITPRSKLIAQVVAAVFMTSWGGVYVSQLGDLLGFGTVHLYNWAIPFTIVCVLGVVNSVNMIDGMDGLAGGISLVALAWFSIVAVMSSLGIQLALLALMISALLGFLLFNMRHPGRSRASVFMGDAGSLMLGFVLVWFAVDLTQGDGRMLPPITAVWILALPLLDMGSVMMKRIVKGQSPFAADRKHVHHILLLAGYTESQVVWMLVAGSALFGGIGVVAWGFGVPDFVMFYAFLLAFCAYYFSLTHAWKLMKVIHKWHQS